MERRTLLAIILAMIVVVVPAILFPPRRPAPRPPGVSRDTAVARAAPESLVTRTVETVPRQEPQRRDSVPSRTVTVAGPLYSYVFSTRGARLTAATLAQYRSFAPGDNGPAQLIPAQSDFLRYQLVVGRDTVAMDDWVFEPSADSVVVGAEGASLQLTAQRGSVTLALTYRFRPDSYRFEVHGRFSGVPGGLVLIGLGPRLREVEADTVLDIRSYGVVTKARATDNLGFGSLDPGERAELIGPFEWVAIKSKYFVAAVLTIGEGTPRLGGALAVGGARDGRLATEADVTASLAAPTAEFRHDVYIGPQEYRRLARIGHDFEDVNPYGWIFRPIIRPFAIMIQYILLWMHETLQLAYGWVLILFGIAVRIVLWPLNQKAMRSGIAMQAIQPEMRALQERYKTDQAKLQQEMLKLYKEHGVNPLGGCLPMLIPMPVLFALFFVFANTIEFRGVPFLWLPDLSAADPFYIIPLVMGVSMYALSKVGQIGVPPNPQAKMMLYIMPVMFTVLFLKFSSGLNLYYAVSNIASIPQQWLIARERLQRVGKTS